MESNNQDIMVLPDSNIKTVSELEGKRIAVNVTQNIGQLLVSSVLSDNAVPVNNVHFVPVQFPDMVKALQQHQVDAMWAPEPFITEAEENAGAVPLADSNQGTTENLPISGYMVTASWLKKNPNTAAAFRRAILKAQAIAATDPAAIQQGMEAFAKVPAKTASIEASPQFPTQSNAALLAAAGAADAALQHDQPAVQRKPDDQQVTGTVRRGPASFLDAGPRRLPGCARLAAQASVSTETCQSSAASSGSRA